MFWGESEVSSEIIDGWFVCIACIVCIVDVVLVVLIVGVGIVWIIVSSGVSFHSGYEGGKGGISADTIGILSIGSASFIIVVS